MTGAGCGQSGLVSQLSQKHRITASPSRPAPSPPPVTVAMIPPRVLPRGTGPARHGPDQQAGHQETTYAVSVPGRSSGSADPYVSFGPTRNGQASLRVTDRSVASRKRLSTLGFALARFQARTPVFRKLPACYRVPKQLPGPDRADDDKLMKTKIGCLEHSLVRCSAGRERSVIILFTITFLINIPNSKYVISINLGIGGRTLYRS